MTDQLGARRSRMIERRRLLDPAERQQASIETADRVAEHGWFRGATRLGSYLAAGAELDPAPLGDRARANGTSTWYPVPDGDGPMTFRRWDGRSALVDGAFGIPVPPPGEACEALELDVVLVPLVLFGPGGVRAGRGGGHYDRTFARRLPSGPPLLCGLAYDFQEVDDLEAQPWDVPLDLVVTATRVVTW